MRAPVEIVRDQTFVEAIDFFFGAFEAVGQIGVLVDADQQRASIGWRYDGAGQARFAGEGARTRRCNVEPGAGLGVGVIEIENRVVIQNVIGFIEVSQDLREAIALQPLLGGKHVVVVVVKVIPHARVVERLDAAGEAVAHEGIADLRPPG